MIRKADLNDLDFLVMIDLKDEGITHTTELRMSEEDLRLHREKIKGFITDSEKGALIYRDPQNNKPIGAIMYLIANRDVVYPWTTIFHEIDRSLFQEDGRFIEIFQLWVAPQHRRSGVATALKKSLEQVAKEKKVNLIYTHTEERNSHVIELNKKLGYKEVRRGPIWDEIIRVSLIKHI